MDLSLQNKDELLKEIDALKFEINTLKRKHVTDIENFKVLESFYKQSQEKYKLLAENIIDVIWVLDVASQRLVYVSPSVKDLTGFTAEEAMSQSILEALVPESAQMVFSEIPVRLAQFLSGDTSVNNKVYEWQQYCKDGSVIWIEITTSFVFNEDKTSVNIIGVSRNIEKRKIIEKQIIEKQTQLEELNSTKDKFFSIIAHDLRNPLGSFKQMLEIISNNFNDLSDSEKKKFILMMKESSNNIYNLLDNLLTWSRLQRGSIQYSPTSYSLYEVLFDSIKILGNNAALKNITIQLECPKGLKAFFDYNMISMVVINLLSNAVKFTKENGNIVLSAHHSQENDVVITSVKDDGVGIPSSKLSKLFRIDSNVSTIGTANEKGTGLGLILCKEFIEKHNCNIWLETNVNQGTTFYFSLPISDITVL